MIGRYTREAELARLKRWNEGKPIPGQDVWDPPDQCPEQDMGDAGQEGAEGPSTRHDDDPEPDEWEMAMSECGMIGGRPPCLQSGTEFCDWECPIGEMYYRARKRKKATP